MNAPVRTAPVDLPAAWPANLTAMVGCRTDLLLAQATGKVLVLGSELPHHTDGDQVDAIVSPAALMRFADLPAALRALDRHLAPGGHLHLVEPVGHPGFGGLLRASLGSALPRRLPAVAGLHLARDVPAAIRALGFTITSIERFDMPTPVWPLRPWMQATARRIVPSPPADDAADGQ